MTNPLDHVKSPEGKAGRFRGLKTLYRETHPGAPANEIYYNLERFKRDSGETRTQKITEWKRFPAYGAKEKPPSVMMEIRREPAYAKEKIPMPRTELEIQLFKENQELKEQLKEVNKENEDLHRRLSRLEEMMLRSR